MEAEAEKLKEAIEAAESLARCGVPLFHYTDQVSAVLILASEELFVTPTFRGGGFTHPSGAYVTLIWPVPPTTKRDLQALYKMGDPNWNVDWFVMLCSNENPTFIPSGYPGELYSPAPPGGAVPVVIYTIGPNMMLP